MNDTTIKFERRELLAVDRCDRCSAAAKTRLVKLIDDEQLDIIFCDHHFRQHEPRLLIDEWWLQDA